MSGPTRCYTDSKPTAPRGSVRLIRHALDVDFVGWCARRAEQFSHLREQRGRLLDLGVAFHFQFIAALEAENQIEQFGLNPQFQVVLIRAPVFFRHANRLAAEELSEAFDDS